MDGIRKLMNTRQESVKPRGGADFKGDPKDAPLYWMWGDIELYSPKYFAACGVGGILSCGLTHAAMTPLDLVKCNAQANPQLFKSTMQGFNLILSGGAQEFGLHKGVRGIVKGWAPTLVGYSIQGMFKFGLYEVCKHYYGRAVGEENAVKYRDLVYLMSSATAEFVADIAYCPFEATKVRIQTVPTFARGLSDGLPKIISQEGFGNLYAGLVPLWMRQIPYTVIKFMAFERIAEFVYGLVPKAKEDMNQIEQMGVVFTSGYIAGIICGAVSHPADTMVSKINKLQMEGSFMEKSSVIYKEIGMKGLWAGFAPRVVMIGTLTGLQWFIYGAFKASVGLPTPGGKAVVEEEVVEVVAVEVVE